MNWSLWGSAGMFMVKAHAGVRRFVFADGNSRRGAARGFGPSWRLRNVGIRAPILVEARANARWPLDFVPDQMANGRHPGHVDRGSRLRAD